MKLSILLLAATAAVCLAKDPKAAEPRYNASTTVDVRGTVTEVHVVPPGEFLPGVHVTLKTKTETVEVYLAPVDFLHLLKATVGSGDEIRVVGSRVGDTILTKEFLKKGTSILLREENGAPVWENWGVVANPTSL
jgi:hypothetical protein